MSLATKLSHVSRNIPHRCFHASLLCLEEYEIDLITLKKRPKKVQVTEDPVEQLRHTLFDDAIKHVKDDKRVVLNMPPKKRHIKTDGEIINLQKPKIVHKEAPTTSNNLVSEPLSSHKSVQDILKLVSVREVSNESQKDIECHIQRLKEIRTTIEEAEKREQEALDKLVNKSIKREEVEKFLNDAKLSKDRDDEQHFREQRRFEWTQSVQSSRTLDNKSFFTPVDEKLIRSVKRSTVPRLNHDSNDVLFPSLPKISTVNMSHEFLVYVKGKQIITNENPFGPHHLPPDLASLFHKLGNDKSLIKIINKLEKSKWRLIGCEMMGDGHVLVFERYIDKKQDKRDKRKRIIKLVSSLIVGSFVTLYTIGFLLEMEQPGVQWSIDKQGELVKKST